MHSFVSTFETTLCQIQLISRFICILVVYSSGDVNSSTYFNLLLLLQLFVSVITVYQHFLQSFKVKIGQFSKFILLYLLPFNTTDFIYEKFSYCEFLVQFVPSTPLPISKDYDHRPHKATISHVSPLINKYMKFYEVNDRKQLTFKHIVLSWSVLGHKAPFYE